jgi:lysophospholipase L1-like esterase
MTRSRACARGTLSLAGLLLLPTGAGAWDSTTIAANGDPANRLDVVVLGDGYTAAQLPQFAADAAAWAGALFSTSPFDAYQPYLNVHRVDVISAQSGADHPDTATFVDTALDSAYGCGGVASAVCADATKTLAAAASAPAIAEVIVVLVNDLLPGSSSAGQIITVAQAAGVHDLALHEFGHVFGQLGDEHDTPPGGAYAGAEPAYPNVTTESNPALVKWLPWITAGTPGVGVFEGALGFTTGVFRPTTTSKMRNPAQPYGAVNSEQLVRRLYHFVNSIDAVTPPAGSLLLLRTGAQVFQLTPLRPVGHALDVSWQLDGVPISTGETLTLQGFDASVGVHQLQLIVRDFSPFVLSAPSPAASATRTWTINVLKQAFDESGGQVVIDAEHTDSRIARGGQDWLLRTSPTGYAAEGFLQALPDTGVSRNTGYTTTSPEAVYHVQVNTPGTYYVWVRGYALDGTDDSVHTGLDGLVTPSAVAMNGFTRGAWGWTRMTMGATPATLTIGTAGLHTVHLWMREDGLRVDRLLLRTDASATPPTGLGPAESVRIGEAPDTTSPVLSAITVTGITASAATITWTTNEPASSLGEYGTTPALGTPLPSDAALVTQHSISLQNLAASTTYHYQVRSIDAANNAAGSAIQTFTTPAPPADPGAFIESSGQLVIETEHYETKLMRSNHEWALRVDKAGFAGSGYMQAEPDTGASINTGFASTSPELIYRAQFATPGTYYLWIRGQALGGTDDSLHAGVDGQAVASADGINNITRNAWGWTQSTIDGPPATLTISTAGVHTIHLWMREDGLRVDRLLLRTDASATPPTGQGPAESPQGSGTDTTSPVITQVAASGVTSAAATVTWTTNEAATSQVEYGLTTAYGALTPLDAAQVTAHSVALSSLAPGTLYHYRVHSRDAANNAAVSADAEFTTVAQSVNFFEYSGQVVIDAEHADSRIARGGKSWQLQSAQSGYAGSGYLQALPDTGANLTVGYAATSPEAIFQVQFETPGTYYVWLLGYAVNGSDDSAHVGVDGQAVTSADGISNVPRGSWGWTQSTVDGPPATLTISTAGVHTIHLWMREDGLRVDRLLLRQSSATTAPAGIGPTESSIKRRIMPFGASITKGSGDPDGFGYRNYLQDQLGVGTVEMVGTFQNPPSHPLYDVDHEGVGGNNTADAKARVPGALPLAFPQPNAAGSAVLVHIGTNDVGSTPLSQSMQNIEDSIALIEAYDASLAVHVALLAPNTEPASDDLHTQFNTELRQRLLALQAGHPNVYIVDINAVFKANPNWATEYFDDHPTHPNDTGYALMAGEWAASLQAAE